jgi:hypothetical protein
MYMYYIGVYNSVYYEEHKKLMKTPKTFRLSDEAIERLEKEHNATQFVEDLIVGAPVLQPGVSITQMNAILDDKLAPILEELNKNTSLATQVTEQVTEQEEGHVCKESCYHWKWSTGQAQYVNSFTGEVREGTDF